MQTGWNSMFEPAPSGIWSDGTMRIEWQRPLLRDSTAARIKESFRMIMGIIPDDCVNHSG